MMEWWEKMILPMRRVWVAFTARVRTRKNGSGLLKLHDDVQTCGYQDVQVMWEMLSRSEMELPCPSKHKQPTPFRRLFAWSSRSQLLDRV